MRVVSVNCGLPREVQWHGRTVTTGIYKQPVGGRVAVHKLNFDGDGQADLSVHGGEAKAVYCYQLAHYDYWKAELPERVLSMGMFGENLTIKGPLESTVFLSDRFSVGSAEVVVTQPRLPCYKLGLRFESDEMVKRFLASARTGFYLAVTREGSIGVEDDIVFLDRAPNSVSVAEITRLYVTKEFSAADAASARQTLAIAALPHGWKGYFRERLQQSRA